VNAEDCLGGRKMNKRNLITDIYHHVYHNVYNNNKYSMCLLKFGSGLVRDLK